MYCTLLYSYSYSYVPHNQASSTAGSGGTCRGERAGKPKARIGFHHQTWLPIAPSVCPRQPLVCQSTAHYSSTTTRTTTTTTTQQKKKGKPASSSLQPQTNSTTLGPGLTCFPSCVQKGNKTHTHLHIQHKRCNGHQAHHWCMSFFPFSFSFFLFPHWLPHPLSRARARVGTCVLLLGGVGVPKRVEAEESVIMNGGEKRQSKEQETKSKSWKGGGGREGFGGGKLFFGGVGVWEMLLLLRARICHPCSRSRLSCRGLQRKAFSFTKGEEGACRRHAVSSTWSWDGWVVLLHSPPGLLLPFAPWR